MCDTNPNQFNIIAIRPLTKLIQGARLSHCWAMHSGRNSKTAYYTHTISVLKVAGCWFVWFGWYKNPPLSIIITLIFALCEFCLNACGWKMNWFRGNVCTPAKNTHAHTLTLHTYATTNTYARLQIQFGDKTIFDWLCGDTNEYICISMHAKIARSIWSHSFTHCACKSAGRIPVCTLSICISQPYVGTIIFLFSQSFVITSLNYRNVPWNENCCQSKTFATLSLSLSLSCSRSFSLLYF